MDHHQKPENVQNQDVQRDDGIGFLHLVGVYREKNIGEKHSTDYEGDLEGERFFPDFASI